MRKQLGYEALENRSMLTATFSGGAVQVSVNNQDVKIVKDFDKALVYVDNTEVEIKDAGGNSTDVYLGEVEQINITISGNEGNTVDLTDVIPIDFVSIGAIGTGPCAYDAIFVTLGGGNDTYVPGGYGGMINGGAGNDTINGGPRTERVFAGSGNDIVHGGGGCDLIQGEGGADELYGDGGDDQIWGGSDNDHIYGGDGADQLFGDAGHDWLYGGNNNDTMAGGTGNDHLYGQAGHDKLEDTDDNDVDYLYGGADNDIINLYDLDFDDYAIGGDGQDAFLLDGEAIGGYLFGDSDHNDFDPLVDLIIYFI
ncbi:MAG: calcium-binding protein [Pirellulaceae bacterium]